MRHSSHDLTEKRYYFTRESALAGNVESVQNAVQTLRNKIPQEELERLVRVASDVAREHWCDEAISEIHECRLDSAATYLQEAYRYGRQGSLPLEFYEVQHVLNLVWESSAPRREKLSFFIQLLPLVIATK